MITTKIEDFTIRFATSEDAGTILTFIRSLADYEKLSHEVVTDEATLKKNLFEDHKYAEVLIGEYKKEPVCFALFFHNFSTFLGKPGIYLEDLYVNVDQRGKGFGKTMLSYLAYLAIERDCGRVEWSVLDWNQSAIDVYESIGAKLQKEWIGNRLTGAALDNLAKQF